MATSLLDTIIDKILKAEGGYVNNPNDNGGPTNFGVTQETYTRYLGRAASINDIKTMPIAHARDIFKKQYYFAPKINLLPEELQPVVTDACVLYGPKRAIIFLQKVLNVAQDGVLGPATAKAATDFIAAHGIVEVVNDYVEERIAFCERIVARNPSQKIFLKGWKNRANTFRLKA
jgi:lysozyme family protein